MEKKPSFVVLCSVFFCQVRQKARRAYGPTAVSPSAVLVPRKLGIHINPPDCIKQVKIPPFHIGRLTTDHRCVTH